MKSIEKVAEYFHEMAYPVTCYYVGGCVRDEIMGIEPEDIDICLVGQNDPQFINRVLDAMVSVNIIDSHSGLVGNSFPVWVVTINGQNYEFAMARKERKIGTDHQDFDFDVRGVTIEEDLYRRDLTINAIAKEVLTGKIVDPYEGIKDIEFGLAHPVSSAFKEDPIRVIRAARFISRFSLRASYSLEDMCLAIKPGNIPYEQIGKELVKVIAQAKQPSSFFKFLARVNWLNYYFPEVAALSGVEQDPINHPEGNALMHTMHCINATTDPFIRIVMLCHDLGKATTTTFNEEKQKWQAIGHEAAGVPITKEFLKRIHYADHKTINRIATLVELHMIRIEFHGRNFDKIVRKYLRRLLHHELTYDHLVEVVRADLAGRPPKVVPEGELIHEHHAYQLLYWGEMAPIVTGKKLIEMGLEPGENFGKILDHALELQDRGTLKKDNWKVVLKGAGYPEFKNVTA